MSDLIRREDAIEAVAEEWLSEASAESPYVNDDDMGKYRELAEELFEDVPSASVDVSEYCDRLWKIAYERGKDEAVQDAGRYENAMQTDRRGRFLFIAKNKPVKITDGMQIIDTEIKALSAEPVQGEWIQKDMCADRFCSCCDYVVWDSEAEEYNYCPNCGAKMHKGGDSE